MTDFASSARPARAAIAWATAKEIFVEIPCKDGPPYIARYRKTIEGLTAALNILIEYPETQTRSHSATQAKVTKVPMKSKVTWASEAQREATRDILKKMKIT